MEKHAGGIPASRMEGWRDAMVAALSALVAVPSVKGDPAPGAPFGADTKRALDLALAWGRDAGFRTKDLDGMCGWIEAGEGDRLVAAVCHLDVVPAGSGWTGDPFLARVIGGRLVARGAVDDKGPAVSAFFALRELQRRGPPPGVRFRLILGLDEESGSQCLVRYGKTEETPTYGFTPDAEFPVIHAEKGIAHVLLAFPRAAPRPVVPPGALRLDAAQAGSRANMVPGACRLTFACDPVQRADWMALAAGVPAFVLATKRDGPAPLPASVTADADPARFHVDVTGLMAHASMPWDGRNALSAAMALAGTLLDAAGTPDPFVDFYRRRIGLAHDGAAFGCAFSDAASGPLTLNAGILALDAGRAALTIDIRYPVTMAQDALEAALRDAVAEAGGTVERFSGHGPLYVPETDPLVASLLAVYERRTGEKARPLAIGGGTYARSIGNVVAFGPVFPGQAEVAHQADESIAVDDLVRGADLYLDAFETLGEAALRS